MDRNLLLQPQVDGGYSTLGRQLGSVMKSFDKIKLEGKMGRHKIILGIDYGTTYSGRINLPTPFKRDFNGFIKAAADRKQELAT